MIQWTKLILRKLFWGGGRHMLSDQGYAKVRYWLELDRLLDLENPQRFTEKIQHIKLNERTELRKIFANRTKVRRYVSEKIGENYLIPLIGVYDELTPKVWQILPEQFVLKANHGCGMLNIVFNKAKEDYEEIKTQTEHWQNFDYTEFGREWAYQGLPRTIVAEQLMLDSTKSIPNDYKFFCFDGNVKLIQIDFDRFGNQKRNLYDRNFKQVNAQLLYPNYDGTVQRPPGLERAIEIAEKLSAGISFLRVDLYLLQNHIYFGELTNYPGNGFAPFKPDSFEYKMGSFLKL